ncbi:tripartite motif-containing protein 10 [Alligator mississippiensis]|uniref:tripartite motif-containing protein 10 n=1 Tax=Alligator mississippiensis TaxID=8496 RepID=UPI0028772BE6|nr:tripartite motif-containing protein 10 [Alligator mississippiensis]
MATARPGQGIQEEIKCPICLEHLTNPVTLECGHNFCQACINDYCETWEQHGPLECPVCRARFQKGNLHPNWQLGNLVDGIKQLQLVPGVVDLCVKHKKELNLFCWEDGAAVCVVCERSPEHRSHSVLLIEEAAQKYKEQIQPELESLRKERKRLEAQRVSESQKHQEYQEKTKAARQKIVSESQRLHQFIEEQKQLQLAQLAELEREIEVIQEETVTKLSQEISHLDSLIREMEDKCQQPPVDLLQDIRSTLSRCKKGQFQLPAGISPELQTRLKSFNGLNLREMISLFQDTLQSYLKEGSYPKVTVTLDPDTAHPHLFLSDDGRSVRCTIMRQRLPDNPDRFYTYSYVLGRQGFTMGRHCWEVEVEVGEEAFWAVGVARESVKRKRLIHLSPEWGIWAVQCSRSQVQALTCPKPTALSLCRVPSRIRVCLDCAAGRVSFLDADIEAPIFTFPPASFSGDRIHPWFWLRNNGAELRLCPGNGGWAGACPMGNDALQPPTLCLNT